MNAPDPALAATHPIVWAPKPPDAAARGLCTDCGLSRTALARECGSACQFTVPNYSRMEAAVHGRARDAARPDELHFGPMQGMFRARLRTPLAGAQWTGITTRLASGLLERGEVDAVLCMAPDPDDAWKPMPVIVTQPEGMAACRGMRMGYAPLLSLIEPALAAGHKRLAVIGIPCQIYALRSIEAQLKREHGLQSLTVIGTPCSDNTTTANFHAFLERIGRYIDADPASITYLEFRADYHVELRFKDGRVRAIPFLQLPLSELPSDFFPLTCRTCVDYTNVLADVTVGYMGGTGQQWVIVRNGRGAEVLKGLGEELVLEAPASAGKRAGPVKGFLANVERAAGGLPLRKMPNWLRPIIGWLMPKVGPRGLEFARARVEMKACETVVHLRREHPRRLRHMVPPHVWALVAAYGLRPAGDEQPEAARTEAVAAE
jgi:coenzyme F420 hydrogenase subunit beta